MIKILMDLNFIVFIFPMLQQELPDVTMSSPSEESENRALTRGETFARRSKLAERDVDFRY